MKVIWLVVPVARLVLAGCAAPGSNAAEKELTSLKDQLAVKEKQISDLQTQNADLKKQLSTAPPGPNTPQMAVGQGDGRFVVVPSQVRPGERIAVFTEIGNGTIRIVQREGMKEIVSFQGPEARQVTLYTVPQGLTPGAYYVIFSGHGGTTAEAVITVEQGN